MSWNFLLDESHMAENLQKECLCILLHFLLPYGGNNSTIILYSYKNINSLYSATIIQFVCQVWWEYLQLFCLTMFTITEVSSRATTYPINVDCVVRRKLDMCLWNTDATGSNKVKIWQKSLSPTFWPCPTPGAFDVSEVWGTHRWTYSPNLVTLSSAKL